jgi:glutamate synthase (NADPH/NADH) small chain
MIATTVGGLLIYGIPEFQARKEVVAAPRAASDRWRREVRVELQCRRDDQLCRSARKARRRADRDGRLQAKPLNAPNDQSVVKALDYLIASNRVGLGDDVAAFTSGALNANGSPRRCHRRRRYRDGLRSHGAPPRRQERDLPLSARPRQHAGLAARSRARGRRGRCVRLARGAEIGACGQIACGERAVRMQSWRAGRERASNAGRSSRTALTKCPGDLIIAALGFDAEDA